MRPPVLLTIHGVTMSMAEWSRKPGAAKYATICRRLNVYGYEHERAVFGEAKRGGHLRLPTSSTAFRKKRLAPVLRPCPHQPNPHPPCYGGFRSWPLEALPILRRVA